MILSYGYDVGGLVNRMMDEAQRYSLARLRERGKVAANVRELFAQRPDIC